MKTIFSAHIDDAILSIGGSIINWVNNGEKVHIIYIFSKSKYLKNDSNLSAEKITNIRKEEEFNVSKKIGYTYEFLDYDDSSIVNHSKNDNIKIYENIITKINFHDDYFFPILKIHSDHEVLASIGKFLSKKYNNIYFYEDLPYIAYHQKYVKQILKIFTRHNLHSFINKINFNKKLELINCYKSQIEDIWIKKIKQYSLSIIPNQYSERYWKFL